MTDLLKLSKLVELQAAKAKATFICSDRQAVPLRRTLSDLREASLNRLIPDIEEAVMDGRRQLVWKEWQQSETRRLNMLLAQHEAALAPLRKAAAKASAREQVIARLLSRQGKSG